MEKSPEPSRNGSNQEIHDIPSNPLPISRENKIWLGIIACILVAGFITLFLLM